MKIYTFRMVHSPDERVYYAPSELDDKYPLYAFTTKKKISKKFKSQRKMDNFISIEIERDGSDADMWIKCHKSKELKLYKLETYINKNTSNQDIMLACVIATDNEITYLMESVEHGGIFTKMIKGYAPIDIFNEKIKEALTYLGYKDAWTYVREALIPLIDNDSGIDEYDPYEIHEIEGSFYSSDFMENIIIDQFGAFILIYDDILSENFYTETKLIPYNG